MTKTAPATISTRAVITETVNGSQHQVSLPRGAPRQTRDECRTVARRALHGDLAAVRAHDVAADAQPEPAAVRRGVAHGIGAEEPLEEARQLLRRDPGAVVAHRQPGVVDIARDADGDAAAVAAVLDGVREQVVDHLAHPVRVDVARSSARSRRRRSRCAARRRAGRPPRRRHARRVERLLARAAPTAPRRRGGRRRRARMSATMSSRRVALRSAIPSCRRADGERSSPSSTSSM